MKPHRVLTNLAAAAVLCLGLTSTQTIAQSAFSPAVVVGDKVVTYYEVEQRALLLALMNVPGDTYKLAQEQLINERLQKQAADTVGIEANPEGIERGVIDFGKRGNIEDPEQLFLVLKQAGVHKETLEAFVRAGIEWGAVVQALYGGSVQISEAEIDRAIASNVGSSGINVLLSEIVIPVTPQTAEQVQTIADQIAQVQSQADFEEAARRYSQSATKDKGGRLNWLSITRLPVQIRPLVLALGPGDVSEPVTLPNAVAVFMMRGKRETDVPAPRFSAIDYAVFKIPGGRSPEALADAAELKARVDTCDDLYGEAVDLPEDRLLREAVEPSAVPRDYALELAKLDDNEISTTLTTTMADGQPALAVLMLCGRSAELREEISREDVAVSLRNQRLQSYAESYLEQLRAENTIVVK
jgi:peptidyl-prolyl cis-trans isomerase SurA